MVGDPLCLESKRLHSNNFSRKDFCFTSAFSLTVGMCPLNIGGGGGGATTLKLPVSCRACLQQKQTFLNAVGCIILRASS